MRDKHERIIERIKARRMQLDLSYQDLADKTGISKSTLQRYESGKIKNLPIDKLEILADALDTSPGYLMEWQEPKAITNAEEAMTFILQQPSLMAFGGYDIKKMSHEDLISFANDLLSHLEVLSYKYKK